MYLVSELPRAQNRWLNLCKKSTFTKMLDNKCIVMQNESLGITNSSCYYSSNIFRKHIRWAIRRKAIAISRLEINQERYVF